jgi:hypothetical protein
MVAEVERVRARMAEELAACGTLASWEGKGAGALQARLVVPPRPQALTDEFGSPGGTSHSWVVADECPGTEAGYLVVYDRRRDEFGLAAKGPGGEGGELVGWYGNLRSALEAM